MYLFALDADGIEDLFATDSGCQFLSQTERKSKRACVSAEEEPELSDGSTSAKVNDRPYVFEGNRGRSSLDQRRGSELASSRLVIEAKQVLQKPNLRLVSIAKLQ